MKISFFIPMKKIPTTTHQQKKVSTKGKNPIFYEPPDLKVARAKFKDHFAAHVPSKKLNGPIRLVTKWCYPITGNKKPGEWKITKPDTDNMVKLPKDIMTELGFWKDDAQVASEIIEKFYNDVPGIYVEITKL